MGFLDKLKAGLGKTKQALVGQIDTVLKAFVKIDEDALEELEEALICADVGVAASEEIIEMLRERIKDDRLKSREDTEIAIREIVSGMIGEGEPLNLTTTPSVILVIGVNGAGKTTSIGKISNRLRQEGKKVVVAAADTFRAAAIDQLAEWCKRADVELVKQTEGSDPAAVVYDAANYARNRGADVLIVDTAGRLHNKKNLMDELNKIYRVIDRELPYSDREVLLVLDATTGQNAVNQAREFKSVADITGIVLTKLDGTARGGVVLAIKNELGIPVKFIGVGEQIDDLQPFKPEAFADGLFDKIDYKEEEDIQLETVEEIIEEFEDANENLLQEENTDENGGAVEATPETDDTGLEEEEEMNSDSEPKEEKKRRGFFGLFNRNS